MADLDELEAKARAVADTSVCWYEPTVDFWPSPHQPSDEDAAFISACDPDTILDLIERVRAGEGLYELFRSHRDVHREPPLGYVCANCVGLTRWESLAHSPQEADSRG